MSEVKFLRDGVFGGFKKVQVWREIEMAGKIYSNRENSRNFRWKRKLKEKKSEALRSRFEAVPAFLVALLDNAESGSARSASEALLRKRFNALD